MALCTAYLGSSEEGGDFATVEPAPSWWPAYEDEDPSNYTYVANIEELTEAQNNNENRDQGDVGDSGHAIFIVTEDEAPSVPTKLQAHIPEPLIADEHEGQSPGRIESHKEPAPCSEVTTSYNNSNTKACTSTKDTTVSSPGPKGGALVVEGLFDAATTSTDAHNVNSSSLSEINLKSTSLRFPDSTLDTPSHASESKVLSDGKISHEVSGYSSEVTALGVAVPRPVARFFRSPLGYAVGICLMSACSVTLSFVIIPVGNPLVEKENIWHCSFTCTVVFVPVSVLYITMLLQGTVWGKYRRSITIPQFLAMWITTALVMSGFLMCLAKFWINPAPMNGAIAATMGIVACSFLIMLDFVPRLGRSIGIKPTTIWPIPDNPLWELQKKVMAVLAFFVLSVVQLMVMLTTSAFLLWVKRWYVSLITLPLVRLCYLQLHSHMARFMDKNGSILGQSMAMVTVGIAMAIAVGSAGNPIFTILFFIFDIAQGLHAALSIADVKLGGFPLSDLLLAKWPVTKEVVLHHMTLKDAVEEVNSQPEMNRSLSNIQTTFMVAAEAGEVIVPMNYALCWFLVRMGPNNASFSGSGTSDFGLEPPDDIGIFIGNIGLLFMAELVSMCVIKMVLWKVAGINLMHELRVACKAYGPVLICQSVWVIVTSFCMTMIHCGLDFSFQYDYL